jgi:hypothetical protein
MIAQSLLAPSNKFFIRWQLAAGLLSISPTGWGQLSRGGFPYRRGPNPSLVLQDLLLEAARLRSVNLAFLEATKSSNIYRDWMVDQPLPRIQLQLPLLPWDLTWKRLSGLFLPLEAVDLHFRALHNILHTMKRRHRF